jgi:oxygen-dependent protoporphyrinogen oxidase
VRSDRLAERLGAETLRLDRRVTGVARREGGGYRVAVAGEPAAIEADALVLACPAHATASIAAGLDPELAAACAEIPYPPMAVVCLGYRREAVAHPLDGFGFLVPAVERRRILGTIFSSTLFPGRAPEGHVAVTTFVGGTRQPDLALGEDDTIQLTVRAELKPLLKLRRSPAMWATTRWEQAIPQYNLGHLARLERIATVERDHPGLTFCANWRGGISVGDCIKSADQTAARVAELLAAAPPLARGASAIERPGVPLSS